MSRLAILDCEHINEVIQDCPEFGQMMVSSLKSVGFCPEFEIFDTKRGDLPTSVSDFAGYIIMGSLSGAYDKDLWIYDLGNFIKDTADNSDSKLVGICFGHQMIGHSLGGRVTKAPQGWGIGCQPLYLRQENFPIPLPAKVNVMFSHGDQIIDLPYGAQVLGHADHCPHAAICIENRILGLQCHPEFSPAFMQKIIRKNTPHFGLETTTKALGSLNTSPDNRLILEVIRDFLLTGR